MTKLTTREKAILIEVLCRSLIGRAFSLGSVDIGIDDVVGIIYPDERPKAAEQTASWTMRNLSEKMEHLGSGFNNASGLGRAKKAVYVFDDKALATARQMKVNGLLN